MVGNAAICRVSRWNQLQLSSRLACDSTCRDRFPHVRDIPRYLHALSWLGTFEGKQANKKGEAAENARIMTRLDRVLLSRFDNNPNQ